MKRLSTFKINNVRVQYMGFVLLCILLNNPLFSQEKAESQSKKSMRFFAGFGPLNLARHEPTGVAMINGFDLSVKKWFIVSGSVHFGRSGNNETDYTFFTWHPDFPENVKTDFYETDLKSTRMNSFSSVGVFALLNPLGTGKTRFIFGPGICYMAWEEISTVFWKGYDEHEFIQISNRVQNSKKLDLGIRVSLERDISLRMFVGANFQGYTAKEEASSISATIGFKLN